ncbi:MAG: GDSL-type esterase/lipase family protein [Prevotella sp.]|jgi:lysophospholipase L1-like esterase|nr:GDSL-type esterase/lipase family protein [Prevotella sp.]
MRKIFTLYFFLFAIHLSAQTPVQKFYIDFGQQNSTWGDITSGADGNGNYWNNVAAPNGAPSTLNAGYSITLVNSANTVTAYVLEVARSIQSNGKANGGLASPDPALLGDLAVATATNDYFFLGDNMGKGLFKFKNLDTGKAYKFYAYGCRTASGSQRGVIYSLSGKNGSHGKQLNTGTGIGANGYDGNNNNIWESSPVIPADNGEITLELGRLFSGQMAYISALKIEEYSGYTLPAAEKKFYIDFGKNNSGLDGAPTVSPDANGNYWNNMYSNGDGPTTGAANPVVPLVGAANETVGYSLELTSTVQFNGVRNGALGGTDSPNEPNASLLGDLAIKTATYDYLFLDNQTAVLNFKNLNTGKLYRFNIFGSRKDDSGTGRVGRIELAGSNTITGIHQMGGAGIGASGENYNNNRIFVSDLVAPDAAGQITLTMTTWLGFAHINCIKLEELAGDELPTATAINIAGGGIALCGGVSQMSVSALPQGALCPQVTWSVDDENIAYISESGKLYAIANGTVTVSATAALENGTVLSDTKEITISGQNVGNYSFTVMGSSVPWGQGAEPRDQNGYAWLWTSYLSQKAANTWTTNNISIGGNNTQNIIDRWDSDLLPSCSRYVYYGLSLGNEGVHERGEEAFVSWRDNMQKIIARTREMGKIPIVGNNYPRGDFNSSDYNFVKQLNLLIHEWDVPSVNLLGAIDNGAGQWATGYIADNAHPNTDGHAEMYYAVVPSLLDAMAAGKQQPVRNTGTSLVLTKTSAADRVAFAPEETMHSFTLSFAFKTTAFGTLASFITASGDTARLILDDNGKLSYKTQTSAAALNDGNWHTATLTHYYAWGKTQLYIDGVRIPRSTATTERLAPERFYLNDFENTLQSVEYRELFLYRAGMCAEEVAALVGDGKMLKSSLEIYAPMIVSETYPPTIINLAQSLNTLRIEEKELPSGVNVLSSDDGVKEMSIYSLAGQRLLSAVGDNFDTGEQLSAGVYIAKIKTLQDNIITRKIVVK